MTLLGVLGWVIAIPLVVVFAVRAARKMDKDDGPAPANTFTKDLHGMLSAIASQGDRGFWIVPLSTMNGELAIAREAERDGYCETVNGGTADARLKLTKKGMDFLSERAAS